MPLRLSTGIKHQLWNAFRGEVTATFSLKDGVIYVYDGNWPASPDNPPTGTLLVILTKDGGPFVWGNPANGLNWAAPANGILTKDPADIWSGLGLAQGTARWFRGMGNATDNLGQSATLPRIDGRCANQGAELNLVNLQVEIGVPVVVSSAMLRFAAGQ